MRKTTLTLVAAVLASAVLFGSGSKPAVAPDHAPVASAADTCGPPPPPRPRRHQPEGCVDPDAAPSR
jgi:hypothetical protein